MDGPTKLFYMKSAAILLDSTVGNPSKLSHGILRRSLYYFTIQTQPRTERNTADRNGWDRREKESGDDVIFTAIIHLLTDFLSVRGAAVGLGKEKGPTRSGGCL